MIRIAAHRMIRIGQTSQRPPLPRQGVLAAGAPRSAMVGDSSPYAADSGPLPKLATLDLRTTTPQPAPASGNPATGVLPPGLALHCAAKSDRTCGIRVEQTAPTHTGITSCHTRHTSGPHL